ncbi:hypothetical protein [Streptomyces sp. NPDC090445]|uniref:hypothetical protein n=1 Tax=Streptomyces sp. NPDC090445 TaxID=3365963 RepID=UPI00382F0CB6
MSTPEEQQRQQAAGQQQQAGHQAAGQQAPAGQQAAGQQGYAPQDPYATQTWQSDTWDTSYQPVMRAAEPVQPQQPVAPEGWFRDDAPAAPAPAPGPVAPQASAGPAAVPAPTPAPRTGAGTGADWAETAYLPPYPGPADPQAQHRHRPQMPPQAYQAQPQAYQAQPQAYQAPVAPDGWFRDEAPAAPAPAPAPAAAPVQDWAAETAYLPPVPQQNAAAAETAYLPPVPPVQQHSAAAETACLPPVPPVQQHSAAAETAYLPPVQEGAAAETAFLPPVQEGAVPEGWFRDAAPAAAAPAPAAPGASAAPAESWAETTAYLPPQAAGGPGAATPGAATSAAGPEAAPAAAAAPGRHAAPAPGGPADPAGEPEWSPATLGGNTMRAVDPAQARAEGRSPIIDPGPQSAVVTSALGLLLAVAAVVGDLVLLLPLVALQGLTAAGWFRLNGMWPARQGIALAFAGALAADAAVLAVDDTYAAGAIIGTLGVWVLLTLVLQLRSQADPDERMYGLMASVASAALAIVCAGYLAADSAAVTVGAAAVAVAVFVRALPLPPLPSAGVSLAAAAGAGIAVGGMTSVGAGGALLGLAAGVCALIGLRVAAYDYPSKFVHMTAGVALPLAAAAPAVYLMGRVVG